MHIFFKLLFLDWSKRLNEAEKDNFAHASDMLPHKAIAHIPSNIDYAQKQIKDLLERVLDMDASKRSVSSRLYDYYKDPYHVDPRPFEFHPLTVSFEMIDRNAYAEVLYPKSIYDLIDYYLREWSDGNRRCGSAKIAESISQSPDEPTPNTVTVCLTRRDVPARMSVP